MGIREYLTESSLSRIYQHIEKEDSVFVIISAFQDNDPEEDKKNHGKLANEIRSMRLGYIEFESQWGYDDGSVGDEKSFFVPNMTKQDGLRLAGKYNQEAILFKDKDGFVELRQNGTVGVTFNSSSQKKNFTQAIKGQFSKLKKGSHRNKKVSFTLKEYKKDCMASAYGVILGGREREKFTIYEESKQRQWELENI